MVQYADQPLVKRSDISDMVQYADQPLVKRSDISAETHHHMTKDLLQ